ncbi:alpha-2-macroglobulin family protein, partial [Patescibacteria group bacterium]
VEDYAPTTKANQLVTGKLFEITYSKQEEGTYYDFIRKVTRKKYKYVKNTKELEPFEITTNENGIATYTFSIENPEARYEAVLQTKDQDGNIHEKKIYLYSKQSTQTYYYGPTLRFRDLKEEKDENGGNITPSYEAGEEVNLVVEYSGTAFETQVDDRFLFLQAQRGLQEVEISETPEYNFTFEEADIPNVRVFGVLFTGEGYVEVKNRYDLMGFNGFNVRVNKESRELNIEVEVNQEEYRPGGEVSVSFMVTDQNDQPVAAELNLNVVDEAYYALYPYEKSDPLGELYSNVSSGVLITKVSREASLDAIGAEGGGGGGDPRSVFKDTAYFASFRSAKNGKATHTFTLPDNITEWRLTTQAIEDDRKLAGVNDTTKVDASLPFFVIPVMRENYLVEDQPTLLLRSAGTHLNTGDTVDYTIEIPSVEFEESKVARADETVYIDLPELGEGTHDIIVSGATGDYEDAVKRPVSIIKSWLVKPIISTQELTEGMTVEGAKTGLTLVTFMDGNRGQYYDDTMYLSYRWGDRADEAVARSVATELLNTQFEEERRVPTIDLERYQQQGIQLLPHGDVDLELSAKIAMLGETPFDEIQLSSYLQNTLYSRPEAKDSPRPDAKLAALMYAGLAALDEPVLAEIQRFAERDDLGTDEKLNIALALYFSGDKERARGIYRELLEKTEEASGYRYLSSDDEETTGERTAKMAILAGGLLEPERDRLFDYLVGQYHGDTLLVLEKAIFLNETLPLLEAGESVVSFTKDGERQTKQIKGHQKVTLALPADQLASLSPSAEQGRVIVISKYDQPIASPESGSDDRLSLKRSYSTRGTEMTSFEEGDLVKVTLNFSADESLPKASYQVTDVLPSGLSPVTRWRSYDRDKCTRYPYQTDGQRVSFYVYPDFSWTCSGTINYFARVVTPGEYKAEPAVIRTSRDVVPFNYSEEQQITISQ